MANREPLSGDVWQSFLPMNLFANQMSQIGFININNAKTPSPELEQTIIEEVGSYGRQIGRLADALDVLIGTLDWSRLQEPQLHAIVAFREQLMEVRRIKSGGKREKEDDLSKPPAAFARKSMSPEEAT
jgi:hypothetical protein